MKQVVFFILWIGLYGTVTNLLYLSPIPSLLSALLIPFLVFATKIRRIPKIVFWIGAFFFISLVNILIYYPISLIEFKFYRYDGNFIISYLPLLVLPLFSLNINIEKILLRFVYFVTILNIVVFILHLVQTKFGAILNFGHHTVAYFSLFKATNAAGGFFSIILSIIWAYYIQERRQKYLILLLINLGFLLVTYSRGSLLGLFLGIFSFYLFQRNREKLIFLMIGTAIMAQILILVFTYPIFSKYLSNSYDISADARGVIAKQYQITETKQANILIRLLDTWPRGIDLFLHSPFVGGGFGAVNDIPIQYEQGIPYLITQNTQVNKEFNDSHAHHSFFHILGEQGLLGLGVFLAFWVSIYQYLKHNTQSLIVRNFLLIAYFNLTIMSLTEHRITTPSNALPFVIILSLYMVYVNYQKSQLQKNDD